MFWKEREKENQPFGRRRLLLMRKKKDIFQPMSFVNLEKNIATNRKRENEQS